MKPKEQLRIRERMLILIEEKISTVYPDTADGSDQFLMVLAAYRADVQRRIDARPLTPEHEGRMRQCMRAAGNLMAEMVADYPAQMAGWYHGGKAQNLHQHLYGILSDALLELSFGVAELEGAQSATVHHQQ